jgi:hypothetical protein
MDESIDELKALMIQTHPKSPSVTSKPLDHWLWGMFLYLNYNIGLAF